jgi:YHS domain-containing protein
LQLDHTSNAIGGPRGLLLRGRQSVPTQGDRKMATKQDPVCKMDVDTKTAETTSQHKGQTYYFCCSDCRDKFNKKPEHYLGGKKATS